MRKLAVGLPVIVSILLWWGCTAPNNNNPANATPTPGPGQTGSTGDTGDTGQTGMDEDARSEAIEAANEKFASLWDQEPAIARQQMLEFLNGRPEFKAAGIRGAEVFAEFADGVLIIFVNNRKVPTNGARKARAAAKDVLYLGIPTSNKSYVANSLGTYFMPGAASLTAELTANGYTQVAGTGPATVDDLKTSVRDAGFLYMDAHGGVGEVLSDGSARYGVWTATRDTTELRRRHYGDLSGGALVLMTAPHDINPPGPAPYTLETHYAFTDRFIRKYMSFAPDSFVFMNCCLSQSSDAGDFRQAFFDSKVSAYAGWTNVVNDDTAHVAGSFLVDRLLGGNTGAITCPGAAVFPSAPAETPPQRPFDYISLLADMRGRTPRLDLDWDVKDDGTRCVLSISANPSDDGGDVGLLAPSIRGVLIDNPKDELQLTGRFGYKQGNVWVTGSTTGWDLTIKSWQADMITCDLPRAAYGDLTVIVDGRASNTVQITAWNLEIEFRDEQTIAGGTGSNVITCRLNLRLRACVNFLRTEPHGPTQRIFYSYPLPARNATASIAATGKITVPPSGGLPNGYTVEAKSRESEVFRLVYANEPTSNPPVFVSSFQLTLDRGQDGIQVGTSAAGVRYDSIHTDHLGSRPSTAELSFSAAEFFTINSSTAAQIPFDAKYGIVGGQEKSAVNPARTMTWKAALAEFPPNPSAAQ